MWTTLNHCLVADHGLPDQYVCEPGADTEALPKPEAVYLKPGELFSGRRTSRVTTILGSCVAVTMYDRKRRAAAMCHAVQSICRSQAVNCRIDCGEKFKSVGCAIDEMVRQMEKMGACHDDIEVKMFGGAALLWEQCGREVGTRVGDLNVKVARRVLAEYDFRIRVMEVGGSVGRKIIFHTSNGAVFLKRIESIRVKEILPVAASCG